MLSLIFHVHRRDASLRGTYDGLLQVVAGLEPAYPMSRWYKSPIDEAAANGSWVRFDDLPMFLQTVALENSRLRDEYAGLDIPFSASITSASTNEEYKKPGRASLFYSPGEGEVRLDILDADGFARGQSEFSWVRELMLRVIEAIDVQFACVETTAFPRSDGGKGFESYGVDHRAFPHRRFLGWMGFTKRFLDKRDIPEAAELSWIEARGGTFIVSIADRFNLHKQAHIETAHRVEMRMVDHDALPVTDPRFL